MIHIPDGALRAYRDQQLAPAFRERIRVHLSRCDRCRARLGQIERAAMGTMIALSRLTPERAPDARHALATLQQRVADSQPTTWSRRFVMGSNRVLRPILAGALVLALLVGVFSFAPSRALARQFLSLFRVQRFAAIQVNPDEARMEEIDQALGDTLFVGEPETVADEPTVVVGSIEEARDAAGFDARLPEYRPSPVQRIEVKGRTEIVMRFRREGLEMMLQLAEMDPSQLPADFQEGEVRGVIPSMVHIDMGDSEIVQAYGASLDYPDGIDPRLIGEASLRLLGVPAEDAQRFTEAIDWTSTLMLPVPADIAEFREVDIAGEQAIVLTPRERSHGEQITLLVQRGDVVYVIGSSRSTETVIQMAESLF